MAHNYNAGYAVVSADPNTITELQTGHKIKIAVLEDGTKVWKYHENNGDNTKWVEDSSTSASAGYAFISDMVSDTLLQEGQNVLVKKYEDNKYAEINSFYTIKSTTQADIDGDVIDNFGLGFALSNGLVAVLGETQKMTSSHFGVYPDGTTDWESSQGARFTAMFAASTRTHGVTAMQ